MKKTTEGITNITENLAGLEAVRPHPSRSSEIVLYRDGEKLIVGKQREREYVKTVREFIMLQIWNTLLGDYNKRNGIKSMMIQSPYPIGILAEENTLLMEHLEGTELSHTYSGNFHAKNPYANKLTESEAVRNSAFLTGRLMHIKEIEGLVHGDLTSRHLLYRHTPSTNKRLSVIDVEKSGLGDPTAEHEALKKELEKYIQAMSDHKAQLERFRRNLAEGYDSVNDDSPMVQDIISTTLSRFQGVIPKELIPTSFASESKKR